MGIPLDDAKAFDKMFSEWLGRGSSKNTGYISSCADIWGLSFAKVKFRVYDGADENKELEAHPAVRILKKPNWFQSWWEIKYRIATDFSFEGNSYLLKLRDGMNAVQGLVQLLPGRITIRNNENNYYYEYQTNNGITRIEPSEIIHLRYPDPENYLKGSPIISKILDLKDIEKMQIAYRKSFYSKGGFLGAIFSTEQKMGDVNFKRMKDELNLSYGGQVNSFNIGLFEQGLKPVATAYSLKDMQMKEDRELNRDEILSAWKVNKLLLGQSENIQRGNADTVFYIFASSVMDPLMNYIDECLTSQWVAIDYEPDDYIKHDQIANKDQELNLKRIENGLTKGWLSVNEVRDEEGYEQWEDEYNRPKQVKPDLQTQTAN